jgi:hypothetical protein
MNIARKVASQIGIAAACIGLGVARATFYIQAVSHKTLIGSTGTNSILINGINKMPSIFINIGDSTMAKKSLEGRTFGGWPTRTPPPPIDRLNVARERLCKGIKRQIASLDGEPVAGYLWYRKINIYHLTLRCAGKKMALNPRGDTAIHLETREEAKEVYGAILAEVQAGDWDDHIGDHLNSITPRKRKEEKVKWTKDA